jgi:8-oxo-dGTP pyrophosphatase MutT (NUDIX family)
MHRVSRRARIERSAGGVVLRTIGDTVHVLLIRDPYRNWGLPKGHVEVGEDDLTAALREVEEETGLEQLTAGPEVATIDWYFRARGRRVHKFCAFFLMVSHDGAAVPEVAEGITECRWVPLHEAPGAISYDNTRQVLHQASSLLRRDGMDRVFSQPSERELP